MASLSDLRLYTTNTHDCSYLPEQKAKTLFIDPEFTINAEFHTQLSEIGFRRSGTHIYRPHCDQCQHCIPCRVLATDFMPNKRFRRILKKNADLKVEAIPSIIDEEYFSLYSSYINTRHKDGDMYPATREQYESFLVMGYDTALFYSIRLCDKLVAVMICDRLQNALSAVFTFYDPSLAKRSLGNFAVLWQIAEAQSLGLPYVYLGYWIKDCGKMNYKTQYRPIELLTNRQWVRLN
jgi:leucyl-tRNA---protein transferase